MTTPGAASAFQHSAMLRLVANDAAQCIDLLHDHSLQAAAHKQATHKVLLHKVYLLMPANLQMQGTTVTVVTATQAIEW